METSVDLVQIHTSWLGALARLLQDREDLPESLPAHVTRISLLAHPCSVHCLGKIVNRF